MKNTDFAYWLQGYFEIKNQDESLTREQALLILEKITLTRDTKTPAEENTASFVQECKTILEFSSSEGNSGMLAHATESIRTKLNDVFEHVIDPSYEGDQKKFNKIHDGSPKFTARC